MGKFGDSFPSNLTTVEKVLIFAMMIGVIAQLFAATVIFIGWFFGAW